MTTINNLKVCLWVTGMGVLVVGFLKTAKEMQHILV